MPEALDPGNTEEKYAHQKAVEELSFPVSEGVDSAGSFMTEFYSYQQKDLVAGIRYGMVCSESIAGLKVSK